MQRTIRSNEQNELMNKMNNLQNEALTLEHSYTRSTLFLAPTESIPSYKLRELNSLVLKECLVLLVKVFAAAAAGGGGSRFW